MSKPTSFSSGQAIRAAIQSYTRNHPQPAGLNPMRVWVIQRMIARLATDEEQRWAVKGAQALLVRIPDFPRATRDLDTMVRANSIEEAAESFTRLIEGKALEEDFLTFTVLSHKLSPIRPDLVKVKIEASIHLGNRVKTVETIGVDILVASRLAADTETLSLHPRIDIGRFTDWPNVQVVSTAQHVAEKLSAMYTTHRGRPSSRTHDFIDITMLCATNPPTVDDLTRALHDAYRAPRSQTIQLVFPERFTVAQPLIDHYQSLDGLPPLEDALRLTESIINPALARFHAEHADQQITPEHRDRIQSIIKASTSPTPVSAQPEAHVGSGKGYHQASPTRAHTL